MLLIYKLLNSKTNPAMKKLLCMVALAAISSGSVFAYGNPVVLKSAAMQTQSDTTKKMKKKSGKMKTKKKTMKKDTTMSTPTM
jgi:hypothetical protein